MSLEGFGANRPRAKTEREPSDVSESQDALEIRELERRHAREALEYPQGKAAMEMAERQDQEKLALYERQKQRKSGI